MTGMSANPASQSTISIEAACDARTAIRPNIIANWLLSVAFLVFIIVVVGGITRLTESGLSITEWKPVTGALPPLNDADWQAEFALYQQTTEYQTEHSFMTLADFKFIYFWEWFHRVIGRLIGLAFALPLLWFWIKNAIPPGYKVRLLALLALGGLQGAIGWWMVASGLIGRTDVSHFRLAVHLLNALLILAGLVWTALDLKTLAKGHNRPSHLTRLSMAVSVVVFIQLLLGAWVAGLNAGYISNSWPLMNGHFVPEGIDWTHGIFFALTHDPYLIHFLHRWWAWASAALIISLAVAILQKGHQNPALYLILTLALQILLGIATVASNMAIWVAVAHQAAGAVLVVTIVWAMHILGRNSKQKEQISWRT